MKKFRTKCDCASLLIGNRKFTVHIDNGLGDGFMITELYQNLSEFDESAWHFLTCINGSFNIYDYDCCIPTKEHIVEMVRAKRTACYNNADGKVALVILEK